MTVATWEGNATYQVEKPTSSTICGEDAEKLAKETNGANDSKAEDG